MCWQTLARLFNRQPSPTPAPIPMPEPLPIPTPESPKPPLGNRATITIRVNAYIQNMMRLDQITDSIKEFENFIESNSRLDLDIILMYTDIPIQIGYAEDGCFVDPHVIPVRDFQPSDVYLILWETNGKVPRLGGETWGGDEQGINFTPTCLLSIDNWWSWTEWKWGTGSFKYGTTQIIIHEFMNAIRWTLNLKYGLHMPNTYGDPPEFDLWAYPDGLKGGYAALFRGLDDEMIARLKDFHNRELGNHS